MIRTITGIPGGGGSAAITIGTTTITGGTTTQILFNNAGVAGEYAISGTGSVAMTDSPVFTTPSLGAATATSINGLNVTLGGQAVSSNVAIGTDALNVNDSGNNNTAVGNFALANNTAGIGNTAIGSSSLYSQTTGQRNSALGSNALPLLVTGSENTAIGNVALVTVPVMFVPLLILKSTVAPVSVGKLVLVKTSCRESASL